MISSMLRGTKRSYTTSMTTTQAHSRTQPTVRAASGVNNLSSHQTENLPQQQAQVNSILQLSSSTTEPEDAINHNASDSTPTNILHVSVWPGTLDFNPCTAHRKISAAIQRKFDGPYHSWKETPDSVRTIWFEEFSKRCSWDPESNELIRDAFEHRGARLMKNLMSKIRRNKKKPEFMTKKVYDDLKAYWESDEFKKLSTKNKANKNSDSLGFGMSLHTGGSVLATEHKRKFFDKYQRWPTELELFNLLHLKKSPDAQDVYVDNQSQAAIERYQALLEQATEAASSVPIEGETTQQPSIDTGSIFIEAVGGIKHGICYGLGSEGANVVKKRRKTGKMNSTAVFENVTPHILHTQEFQEALSIAVNQEFNQRVEAEVQARVEHQVRDRIDAEVQARMEEIRRTQEEQDKKQNDMLRVLCEHLGVDFATKLLNP